MTSLRSTITKANESIRGHDIGDVCDRLWANAFGTAPLGKPEPQSPLSFGPSGECRFRKEQSK
jgi:hypothetical protein